MPQLSRYSQVSASPAVSATVLSGYRVFRREFMSSLAMGFSNLPFSLHSSFAVFLMRYWFQMLWIHAGHNSAKMVENKSIRNLSNMSLIVKSMCLTWVSSAKSISMRVFAPLPYPARTFISGVFQDKGNSAFPELMIFGKSSIFSTLPLGEWATATAFTSAIDCRKRYNILLNQVGHSRALQGSCDVPLFYIKEGVPFHN